MYLSREIFTLHPLALKVHSRQRGTNFKNAILLSVQLKASNFVSTSLAKKEINRENKGTLHYKEER